MSAQAPTSVVDLLTSQPRGVVIANLFQFTLLSGPVYTFTDWRRSVTAGGVTYLGGPPRVQRGSIKTERGMVTATQDVTFQEANSTFIAKLAQGYFNRAIYQMSRVYAPDRVAALGNDWTDPIVKFFGRVNNIEGITRTTAKLTIKSMIDDLDNDFPRQIVQTDCDAVLFDARCGLSAAGYAVSGIVSSGSTKNTLLSNLTQADVYFTQGVITFTSGPMAGISYMVKKYAAQVLTPAYPFLVVPAADTTFTITPGCDKTLATCQSKYGYNPGASSAPFHRGKPFVPDPTVTY